MNLLENLRFFYRSVPDGAFPRYGGLHLFFAVLCLGCVYFVAESEDLFRIRRGLFWLLVFDMVNRYGFYLATGYTGLSQSLPLYHCRMVAILSLIYLRRPSEILGTMIFYWGLFGALAALVYPDPDLFRFPHILLLLFFLYHSALFAMAVVVLRDGTVTWPVGKVRWVTFLYNLTLIGVNALLHSNYGMMTKPPLLPGIFLRFGRPFYSLLAILFFDGVLRLLHRFVAEPARKWVLAKGLSDPC